MSGVPSGQDQSGDALNRELRGIQFRAVTAYNRVKDDVSRLGTSHDTPEVRRRLAGNTQRFGELAHEFRRVVETHPDKESVPTQKIVRDFQSLLQRSETLLKTAKAKETATLPKQGGETVNTGQPQEDKSSDYGKQEQQLIEMRQQQKRVELERNEGELQYNEALIGERDRAITEITGQIGEVHQIFQDLAVLVHDQGEMVDDIEANLTRAANRTIDAHTQLIRAERSQRKARSTWCFLMMLLFGAVSVLVLIVLA
jgi:syntaxin 7